jgi:phosphopantothenoylcysteine decarboxylase/phosphopantothenate--cysteine ligase
MAAAVADYHVKNASAEKIKRKGPLELSLEPNPDILADLGSLRHAIGKRAPVLIGFAAETDNLVDNARAKLESKRVDAVVLNNVGRTDIGFNSDRNEVTIITPTAVIEVPAASKRDIAQKILDAAVRIRQTNPAQAPAPARSR